jgi:hypothetical protein
VQPGATFQPFPRAREGVSDYMKSLYDFLGPAGKLHQVARLHKLGSDIPAKPVRNSPICRRGQASAARSHQSLGVRGNDDGGREAVTELAVAPFKDARILLLAADFGESAQVVLEERLKGCEPHHRPVGLCGGSHRAGRQLSGGH